MVAVAGVRYEICGERCHEVLSHTCTQVLLIAPTSQGSVQDCRHCVVCGSLTSRPATCLLHDHACPDTDVLPTVPVRLALQLWRQGHRRPFPTDEEAWDRLEQLALGLRELGASCLTAAALVELDDETG
ncbi:hypothetical protein [Phycicoccus sp. DTK01]|uniref:hypothetical protein n=1 Tax=Phycicoccus sp. DTK01 TaxID=2785745 RepID=UPI001A90BC7D|nr:hypothetical protein [Phycicoccus sp. DTK01]GIL37723.1 hypothetical protein PDTK01_37980 [Phycicoccus sp. DTK01]